LYFNITFRRFPDGFVQRIRPVERDELKVYRDGCGNDRYSVIIRFSALGDVLLTLPVLGPLAEATSTRVIFVTRKPYENLIARHPGVSAVYTIPARGSGGRADVGNVCERINADFGGKISFAADLHRVPLSRYAVSLIKADEKTAYRKYGVRRLILATFGIDLLPRPTVPVPELYADAFKSSGVNGPDYGFRLAVDATRRDDLLDKLGLRVGYAAVFPGAVYPTKAWYEDKYGDLVRRLTGEGIPVAVMGAPDERELCERVAGGASVPNLAGEVTVDDLPEVLSAAAVVIGNDSAPIHFASVLGVPAIAIFGPTSPRFGFVPWVEGSEVLYAGSGCSPCSRHGRSRCWRSRRYCFDGISMDGVLTAVVKTGGF
jgi:ADP-heptose:LPS heptosyltransferase